MIKIYYSFFDQQYDEEKLHHLLHQLPMKIQGEILRFRNWEDVQRSLLGKLLLKKALKDFGYDDKLSNLEYDAYKRPFIRGYPEFNITHSGNYAACVVSTLGRVGIDIEEVKPIDLSHFESQFSEIEWRQITGATDSISKFFFYWTIKEAVIKADGRGFSLPLNSFSIYETQVNVQGKIWHYKMLSVFPGHQAHVACEVVLPQDIATDFKVF